LTPSVEEENFMAIPAKITPRENGPLVVTNPPTVRHLSGSEIATKDVVALCRCGASASKPFCDGSHAKIGFSSAPDHARIRNTEIRYSGEVDGFEVTVSYTPVLCGHAGECARLAAAAFDPTRKPWVKPENGSLEGLLSVVGACPSGALRLGVGDQPSRHLTPTETAIEIEPNGPYWVRNVHLEAEFNGVGASPAKYILCRCGQSKNKPFCDGTHHDIRWRDASGQ
jgi:CDGSH-type Zn-finger protein